jgi:hypothetical protein
MVDTKARRPSSMENEAASPEHVRTGLDPSLAPPGISPALWRYKLAQRRARHTEADKGSETETTAPAEVAGTTQTENEQETIQAAQASVTGPTVQPGGSDQGVLSTERAREILQDAFGTWRTISTGNVKVLAQKDFEMAYDAIYGGTEYSWDKWVKPTYGNLNGFAYEGTNYINKNAANVTTVPHEMLHNNAASDWRPFVGSPFDEGATEYLEQHALRKAGIKTQLTHYPNQRGVVESYLKSGVAETHLFEAYLKGGASTIVGQWVDGHCKGRWADVKSALEKSNWATAKAYLAAK